MAEKKKRKVKEEVDQSSRWPFGKKNYILFGVSLIVIILGFILLGRGSITMAPILLVAGYCVLMPLAIILRDKDVDAEEPVTEESGE